MDRLPDEQYQIFLCSAIADDFFQYADYDTVVGAQHIIVPREGQQPTWEVGSDEAAWKMPRVGLSWLEVDMHRTQFAKGYTEEPWYSFGQALSGSVRSVRLVDHTLHSIGDIGGIQSLTMAQLELFVGVVQTYEGSGFQDPRGDEYRHASGQFPEESYKEWFPERLCRAIISVPGLHLEEDLHIHDAIRLRLLWTGRIMELMLERLALHFVKNFMRTRHKYLRVSRRWCGAVKRVKMDSIMHTGPDASLYGRRLTKSMWGRVRDEAMTAELPGNTVHLIHPVTKWMYPRLYEDARERERARGRERAQRSRIVTERRMLAEYYEDRKE